MQSAEMGATVRLWRAPHPLARASTRPSRVSVRTCSSSESRAPAGWGRDPRAQLPPTPPGQGRLPPCAGRRVDLPLPHRRSSAVVGQV